MGYSSFRQSNLAGRVHLGRSGMRGTELDQGQVGPSEVGAQDPETSRASVEAPGEWDWLVVAAHEGVHVAVAGGEFRELHKSYLLR